MTIQNMNYMAVPGLKYKQATSTKDGLPNWSDLYGNTPKERMMSITRVVCDSCMIEMDRLFIKTRKREVVYARQIVMYLSCFYSPYITLKFVGDFFGGFDHTTVLHSRDTVTQQMTVDEQYKKVVDVIKQDLLQDIYKQNTK